MSHTLKTRFRNNEMIAIILLFFLTSTAIAYNKEHGPFPDDAEVERIELSALSRVDEGGRRKGASEFEFMLQGRKESRLRLVRKSKDWYADLIIEGEKVLPSTPFSNFDFNLGMEAYSADINRDDISDFVIYSYSGGCGLACGYCNVAFVLSSEGQYRLGTVKTLFPDERDFIILDEKPYYIHTSFHRVENCNDDKNHNFWIYNLIALGAADLCVDNSPHPAFPKTVWYTFKPNHAETSIITDRQKADLRKDSLADIFWNPED